VSGNTSQIAHVVEARDKVVKNQTNDWQSSSIILVLQQGSARSTVASQSEKLEWLVLI